MSTELNTGLHDLDAYIGKLLPGDVMLVGGRPNSGKSVLAANLAIGPNHTQDGAVVLYSMSESVGRVARRLWEYAGTSELERRRGEVLLANNAPSHFVHIRTPHSKAPIIVCDHPNVSVADIGSDIHALNESGTAVSLLIVDYVQTLAWEEDLPADQQGATLSARVAALKTLAVSLHVPVVLLSTLNRLPLEQRDDQRPVLSDLSMSREAIAHTDTVILLYRSEVYSTETPANERAEIHVVKSKAGNVGTAKVRFNLKNARFENHPMTVTAFVDRH